MKCCILTGHRHLPRDSSAIRLLLRHVLIRFIEQEDYTDFLCGGAMGFDLLAADTVLELKELYPHIRLRLFLPFRKQAASYPLSEQRHYESVLARADTICYTAEHHYTGCYLARDRAMASAAQGCICYLSHSTGGTAYTVRQAALLDIPIVNLAELLDSAGKESYV